MKKFIETEWDSFEKKKDNVYIKKIVLVTGQCKCARENADYALDEVIISTHPCSLGAKPPREQKEHKTLETYHV